MGDKMINFVIVSMLSFLLGVAVFAYLSNETVNNVENSFDYKKLTEEIQTLKGSIKDKEETITKLNSSNTELYEKALLDKNKFNLANEALKLKIKAIPAAPDPIAKNEALTAALTEALNVIEIQNDQIIKYEVIFKNDALQFKAYNSIIDDKDSIIKAQVLKINSLKIQESLTKSALSKSRWMGRFEGAVVSGLIFVVKCKF